MRFIKMFLVIAILLLATINTGCGKQPLIDIEKWTNDDDADTAPGPEISVGDIVTWTYKVTNTGSSTLESILVTDDKGLVPQYLSGDDNRDNIMQVGEKWTYQATGTATEGQYKNVGTVTGKYKSKIVTDSDSAFYLGGAYPSIDIEKATNGQDSDTPPGLELAVDSDITWTYSVTNTGNVDLINVVVADDDPLVSPAILNKGDGDELLEVNETWTYRATGKAIQGQYSNTGSVEAWHNATKVTDVDLSHYFGAAPSIDLEKLVNGADADSAPGPVVSSGANVTFSFIVRNMGNVTLTNVAITDSKLGTIGNIASLAIGAQQTFTKVAAAATGQHTNTGSVTSTQGATDSDLGNYFGTAPAYTIDKTVVETSIGAPGVLHYKVVLSNTGNIDLTGVTLIDSLVTKPGSATESISADGILNVGETWTWQYTYSVTQGQIDAGVNIVNTATGDCVQLGPIQDSCNVPVIQGPAYTIDKTVTETSIVAPGLLHYKVVLRNTGNINLTGVTLFDSLVTNPGTASESISTNGVLNVGETWTWSYTYSVSQGQIDAGGNMVNTATGDCAQLGPIQDSCTVPILQSPGVDLKKLVNDIDADSAPGPLVTAGTEVTFKYLVANTGNVTLTNVSVSDIPLGLIGTISSLVPGASRMLTKAANAAAGQHTNTGSATSTQGATDSDFGNYFGTAPTIDIEKFTNGQDADDPNGQIPELTAGDEVIWTYRVQNTGNVDLDKIEVTDSEGEQLITMDKGDGDAVLSVNEVWVFQANGIAVPGLYSNIGTAVGYYGALRIEDSDPSNYYVGIRPVINIRKLTNSIDVSVPPGPIILVNDPVTWTYIIRNNGNVDLTGIVVSDSKVSTLNLVQKGNGDETLQVNEEWVYEASGRAIEGQYSNTGVAEGWFESTKVSSNDTSYYFGSRPSYLIEKTVTETSVGEPGLLHYKVVLRNTGNIDLTGVKLIDSLITNPGSATESISANGVLNVGETWTWSYTYSVTQGQIDAGGSIVNTATGDCAQLGPIQDSCSVSIAQGPSIDLEKLVNGADADSAPGPLVPAGSEATFKYVVSNTGNITLTNIVVNDNPLGLIGTITSLAPGASQTLTFTETAVEGQHTNTGSVTSTQGASDFDFGNYFGTAPAYTIDKAVTETSIGAPGLLHYTLVLRNTGNMDLTGVTLNDSLVLNPGSATESISANGILNVGETWTWQYTYNVTQGQIDAGGNIVNTATADCAQLGPIQDSCSVPITQNPGVDLKKLVNDVDADTPQGPYVVIGSEVTYKFIVRNTGNTTLTNVVVTDNIIGLITTLTSLSVGTEQTIERTAPAAAGQHTNIGTVTTAQGVSDTDSANYFGVTDKTWTYDFTTATDIVSDGWVIDDSSLSSVNSVHSSRNPLNFDEGYVSGISPESGHQLISGQGLFLDYIGVSSPYAFTGDFTMEVLFSLAVDSMNTFNMQLYPGDTQIAWPDNYVYTDFYRMGEIGNESWYVDENHLNNYITIVEQLGTIPGLNRTGVNTWKLIKQGNQYEVWINSSKICDFTATICAGSKYYVTLYAEPKLNGLLYFKRVTVSFDGQMVNIK